MSCLKLNANIFTGVVKLNLQISNWPFCGNRDIICEECHTYHVGKYLDLELALKGSSAAKKYDTDKTNGSRLSVESAEILFSQQVCLCMKPF